MNLFFFFNTNFKASLKNEKPKNNILHLGDLLFGDCFVPP